VRLTSVLPDVDPSGQLFDEPPVDGPVAITRIARIPGDALPFALCVSVTARPGLEVSVALGNIVLADHGASIDGEPLAALPPDPPPFAGDTQNVGDCCNPPVIIRPPLRYNPFLGQFPLTHGFDLESLLAVPVTVDEGFWSAAALRALDVRDADALVGLIGTRGTQSQPWTVQRDLLASDAGATDFVAEVTDDGRARLRFGDGTHGQRPDQGTTFAANYRVGNGASGNVGADTLAHLDMVPALAINSLTNPLAAFGGTEAEDVEAARRDAPQAFRTQERAVTAADYAAAAERRADVQRAAATFRWTGSWYTVFVTADRVGGAAIDAPFETRLRRHLERFRIAGYDLELDAPRFVALDVELHLCVKVGHFRSDVLQAARAVLSSRLLADGTLGLFHPDNFTFGRPVYLSRIIAAAQSLAGVESVRVDRFQRLIEPNPATLADGVIPIGRLEIAQLSNNPNFPDQGRLLVTAGGGQ
jgi:hypothetical protein